jgi:hypothetical protein
MHCYLLLQALELGLSKLYQADPAVEVTLKSVTPYFSTLRRVTPATSNQHAFLTVYNIACCCALLFHVQHVFVPQILLMYVTC